MLRTSPAVAQPRRAVWTESVMFVQPAGRVGVGRADDPHAGAQRLADVLTAKIEAGGKAVDLERHAGLQRDLEHALEVEGVLRAAGDEPARGMAQTADGRVAQRLLDALGQLASRHPLPAVHARLDPVELGQDVVGKIEPTVGQDVALDPAQDAERGEELVGRRDLLRLAAHVVGGQPAHGSDSGRVIADRDVVVPAVAGGARPSPRRSPGRPTTSCGSAGRRGCRPPPRAPAARRGTAPRAAPVGTTARRARGRRAARRARRAAARARRRRRRAGRAHERGPERGGATTSSTGTPSTVTPTARRRPARARRRSAAARRSAPAPATGRRGADHGQQLARVAPAAHIAGRFPVEGAAMPPTSSQARLSSSPRCGRGAASRASASRAAPRSSARCRGRSAAGRRPPPRAARRASGPERLRDVDRAPRAEPEIAAEADERRGELALELGQLLDRAGLDELAQPRLDPGADPAQLAHRARSARAPRREPVSCGSSRPRDGRHAPCRDWPRRTRAASRRRRPGRRCGGCPPVRSRGPRRSTRASCRSRSIRSHGHGRGRCTGCPCSARRGGRRRRGRGRR